MNTPLQFHLTAIAFALALVWLMHPSDIADGLQLFGIFFTGMELGVWGFVFWRRRANKVLEEEFRREMAAITPDEARRRALAVLEGSEHAPRSKPLLDPTLPSETRDVFNAYERATFKLGDVLELGGREQGFIDVGRTSDGARLLVREEDGGVFEWDARGVPPSGAVAEYPSLFHWINTRV